MCKTLLTVYSGPTSECRGLTRSFRGQRTNAPFSTQHCVKFAERLNKPARHDGPLAIRGFIDRSLRS
ncbi:hypothetical protein Y1Q_0021545 [Alligator mississippiensis]|uniref:Uncharacterized protein n=1 Tax=Alligator mississippiensis TaxID=8496 RepID=A0A151PA65_ALLMI|nr:hypothetical protein Y1Q_0021545 [Alligator mississippiensis]